MGKPWGKPCGCLEWLSILRDFLSNMTAVRQNSYKTGFSAYTHLISTLVVHSCIYISEKPIQSIAQLDRAAAAQSAFTRGTDLYR